MSITEILRRLRYWMRRDRLSDEMDEEMRLHVELRARANLDRGLSAPDADLAARRRFGNRLVLREQGRDAWGFAPVERWWRDMKFAFRRVLKQRTLTMVAVATLAIGIGANSAMFSLLNATLFRSAPVSAPDELVWITLKEQGSGRFQFLSYREYATFRDRTDAFVGVAAFSRIHVSLGGERPERVQAIIASGDYFDVLGIRAQHGRLFSSIDDRLAAPNPVVVLGDAFWKQHFGGDPSVVNKNVSINGHQYTVIGVLPAGFIGLEMPEDEQPAMWLPLATSKETTPGRDQVVSHPDDHWLQVVARLSKGTTVERASAVVGSVYISPNDEQVQGGMPRIAVVAPVMGGFDPPARAEMMPVLLLLEIVPALVLIVASANVGNLLLASGLSRRRELSLRRALGATRSQLVRQLLAESFWLSLGGAVAAIPTSIGLIQMIGAFGRVPPLILETLRPDGRVLIATMVIALLSIFMFGLLPALSVTKDNLSPSLRDDGTIEIAGRRRRLRNVFVVAQVALSVTLIITAGLFLQSLSRAVRVDPGFDVTNAVTLSYDLELQGYPSDRREAVHRQILDRVRAVPGVKSAAIATTVPLGGIMWGTGVRTQQMAEDDAVQTFFAGVSTGYLETLGIPLLKGRPFSDKDNASAPKTVIVNETLAAKLWPDGNALGQLMKANGRDEPWREVIGIARNVKYDALTERPRSFFYLPVAQWPTASVTLVTRTAVDPLAMISSLVDAIRAVDRDLPVYRVSTLAENIDRVVDLQRASSSLLGVFGVLALLLAALGIYGVSAHAVSLRIREIGIRRSLGAQTSHILRMVISDGVRLTAVGVACGILVSVAVSRVLATFLFGLKATDAATFIAGASILAIVAIVACSLPARRAAGVDPIRALRHE